jgi:hypothetical protein
MKLRWFEERRLPKHYLYVTAGFVALIVSLTSLSFYLENIQEEKQQQTRPLQQLPLQKVQLVPLH